MGRRARRRGHSGPQRQSSDQTPEQLADLKDHTTTDAQPRPDAARIGEAHPSEGKPAALIAWALYILSIPSANLLVIVGLVVAYAARGSATGNAREHIEAQIALFWSVFWWTIVSWIGLIVSGIASLVLIGIPFFFLFLAMWFLLSVWFTVKSVLALINLLQDCAP